MENGSYYHFRSRARERFNMSLHGRDMEIIKKKIKNGKVRKLYTIEDHKEAFVMVVKQTLVVVIYDRMRDYLVTILAPSSKVQNDYYNQMIGKKFNRDYNELDVGYYE